jgi:hypothetical protein
LIDPGDDPFLFHGRKVTEIFRNFQTFCNFFSLLPTNCDFRGEAEPTCLAEADTPLSELLAVVGAAGGRRPTAARVRLVVACVCVCARIARPRPRLDFLILFLSICVPLPVP